MAGGSDTNADLTFFAANGPNNTSTEQVHMLLS